MQAVKQAWTALMKRFRRPRPPLVPQMRVKVVGGSWKGNRGEIIRPEESYPDTIFLVALDRYGQTIHIAVHKDHLRPLSNKKGTQKTMKPGRDS